MQLSTTTRRQTLNLKEVDALPDASNKQVPNTCFSPNTLNQWNDGATSIKLEKRGSFFYVLTDKSLDQHKIGTPTPTPGGISGHPDEDKQDMESGDNNKGSIQGIESSNVIEMEEGNKSNIESSEGAPSGYQNPSHSGAVNSCVNCHNKAFRQVMKVVVADPSLSTQEKPKGCTTGWIC
ncbi:unnamed protein product [Calypogeia fissa]